MEIIRDEMDGLWTLNSFRTCGTPGANTVDTIDLGQSIQMLVRMHSLSVDVSDSHVEAAQGYQPDNDPFPQGGPVHGVLRVVWPVPVHNEAILVLGIIRF